MSGIQVVPRYFIALKQLASGRFVIYAMMAAGEMVPASDRRRKNERTAKGV
jgi:hypothetical protein